MKLVTLLVLGLLVGGSLAFIPNIGLGSFGKRETISSESGQVLLAALLTVLILSEFGYFPYTFEGRKKRSAHPRYDRDAVLMLVTSLDENDCLLRYTCELEAMKMQAEREGTVLDDRSRSHCVLLDIAKRRSPAALPFEMAVSVGATGFPSCAVSYNSCPYNAAVMRSFVAPSVMTLFN